MKGIIGEVRRMGSRGHCLTLLRMRAVPMADRHPCLLSPKMSHSHYYSSGCQYCTQTWRDVTNAV